MRSKSSTTSPGWASRQASVDFPEQGGPEITYVATPDHQARDVAGAGGLRLAARILFPRAELWLRCAGRRLSMSRGDPP